MAPDHGSWGDQRPCSTNSRLKAAYEHAAIASVRDTQRISVDKLDTTGSRVLLRKPNSDSSDNWTGTRKGAF
jgi:hypothetical protein